MKGKVVQEGIHLSQLMNLEIGFRDEEGRPLAENKVPPNRREDVPMELTECPYSGSRHRHFKPMNVTALKQMINHWPEVISQFNCMRNFCVAQKNRNEITLLDFF